MLKILKASAGAGKTYQFMLLYVEVALIYLLFSTVLTWLQRWGERKLDSYGGSKG